jgi:hypothetical protein
MTAVRRSHYEQAFERFLSERGIAYVSVDDARHAVGGRPRLKLFDYIVYPPGGVNYLVDVKGRKVRGGGGSARRECWVTRGDLEGLERWAQAFGNGFEAAFVFAYWLEEGAPARARRPGRGEDAPGAGARVCLAGRQYEFVVVRLNDYRRHARQRSPRWRTVTLGSAAFRSCAQAAWADARVRR